ncbi:hypothetical protein ACLVPO_09280, partial [Streptococcus pneumoniae]|nr:hypothetical protein [Streptococcus pneumoniae]MDG8436837.1 hypothetical protein [Streptococcus pneumoniae]
EKRNHPGSKLRQGFWMVFRLGVHNWGGSIAYQFLVWAVIALGFNTSYLRLYSALILAVCLMIPTFKQTILKGAKLSK